MENTNTDFLKEAKSKGFVTQKMNMGKEKKLMFL